MNRRSFSSTLIAPITGATVAGWLVEPPSGRAQGSGAIVPQVLTMTVEENAAGDLCVPRTDGAISYRISSSFVIENGSTNHVIKLWWPRPARIDQVFIDEEVFQTSPDPDKDCTNTATRPLCVEQRIHRRPRWSLQFLFSSYPSELDKSHIRLDPGQRSGEFVIRQDLGILPMPSTHNPPLEEEDMYKRYFTFLHNPVLECADPPLTHVDFHIEC